MRPSNTAYFLDFDHTLFHTDRFFHVDLRAAFIRFGISASDWEQSYAAVWPAGYSLEKHAEEVHCRSGRPLPLAEMKRVLEESFSDLSGYVFPDVLRFLERALAAGGSLYLLSFGDPEWQRYKVSAAGLAGFFDRMFFTATENRKAGLILEQLRAERIPQEVAVIDNDPEELDLVRDAAPGIRSYWMNRVPDDARLPADELSPLQFLEARRYLEKTPRHRHIPCRSLDQVPIRDS